MKVRHALLEVWRMQNPPAAPQERPRPLQMPRPGPVYRAPEASCLTQVLNRLQAFCTGRRR